MYITNNDKDITSTDYWTSPAGKLGRFFLSFNAGACRILYPNLPAEDLKAMKLAEEIIISIGVSPDLGDRLAYEILFDDTGINPYSMHTTTEAADRILGQEDHGKSLEISIWTEKIKGGSRKTCCIFRRKAKFRVVPEIPCLEPWR